MASAKNIRIILNSNFSVSENDFSAESLTLTKTKRGKDGLGTNGERTTQITFRNSAKALIIDSLAKSPNGHLNSIKIEIFENCCSNKLIFTGKIKGDSLNFCENDCEMEVQAVEDTEKAQLIDFLKSTFISDSNFVKNTLHLQCPYCLEYRPLFLGVIVLILGAIGVQVTRILSIILVPIALLVEVVNIIVKIVTVGTKSIAYVEDRNLIKDALALSGEVKKYILRCSGKHPAIKQSDWIEPLLAENGYGFESSIIKDLSSKHSEGYVVFADSKKGWENETIGLIEGNEPLITAEEFLDKLATFYNAQWFVENLAGTETVYFEPKSINLKGDRLLFNKSDVTEEGICYEITDKETPAKRQVNPVQDGFDLIGNEAKEDYEILIDWDSGNNPNQRGIEKLISGFAPARFYGDGIEKSPLEIKTIGKIFATILGINTGGLKRRLLLSNGLIPENAPKILHLDNDGKAINNNALFKNEKMKQFHKIDNPNLNTDYKPARFSFETNSVSCNQFEIYADAVGREISLDYYSKVGIVEQVDINLVNRSFIISGIV